MKRRHRGQSTCEKLFLTADKKKWRTLVTLKLIWREGTGISYIPQVRDVTDICNKNSDIYVTIAIICEVKKKIENYNNEKKIDRV